MRSILCYDDPLVGDVKEDDCRPTYAAAAADNMLVYYVPDADEHKNEHLLKDAPKSHFA